jgi:uncharacterized membrane protein
MVGTRTRFSPVNFRPWLVHASLLGLAAITFDADAALSFCNKTGNPVTVAIAVGQKDGPGTSTGGHLGVTVEGWWKFKPGECGQVSDANAGASWLYYHAHSSEGAWEGDSRLCVRSRVFTSDQQFLHQGGNCRGDYRAVGFRRIDASKKHYTMNLTR